MNHTATFDFITQQKLYRVRSSTICQDPVRSAQARKFIRQALTSSEGKPAKDKVVCGIIPFNPQEPAYLLAAPKPQAQDPAGLVGKGTLFSPGEEPQASGASRLRADISFNQAEERHYLSAVERALTILKQGEVHKIVLGRYKRYTVAENQPLQGIDLAGALHRANPRADTFCLRTADQQQWVGASPEVVADVRDHHFYTHPLAGSRHKQTCSTLKEAQQVLLNSSKDLYEHSFVVEHICQQLQNMPGVRLGAICPPEITETDSMYHLGTPMSAQVPAAYNPLQLALQIHPTPAVGGTPAAIALPHITRLERTPRQYFAGLVGWMDGAGQGRWSLILRSAHIYGSTIDLWAGAGIVQGSEPDLELAETEAKMLTILSACQNILSPNMVFASSCP
ncbi:isochorismate synthase [Rothia nasimurium]|uniref:isochorismate synthase n=1 Tax=Rothia nasimurium TaxID=85336 RepID=UPI001F1EF808|nr:chorismate-binding protein [Rothia nasimurium]